ncbi:MAG: ABC transporter permease [Ignavibacteriales bacterium]|nr:ABC transporter permease [Ignavibacteriales bacterium]
MSKKDSRFISAISLITIIGIALGIIVVVIALSVLDGFEKVVSEKIVGMNSHIKITSFGNRNLPPPEQVIPYINQKYELNIAAIEPFASKLAIIKSRKRTEGITINGIRGEESASELKTFMTEGNFNLSGSDSVPKIILGKKLAEKLFVQTGDNVTIFALKKDEIPSIANPPSIIQLKITGIYESGMAEYDDLNAYVNISVAQSIFGMGSTVSGYHIKLKDVLHIKNTAEGLQDLLGYPFYVRTIFQIHQNIFTWLELQKEPIPIILGLIIFVAVFNIVGTLLMIVLERTNSIGILKSLGASRLLIMKMFLYHSIFITAIGVLLGNLLALIFSWVQINFNIITLPGKIYFVSEVPIQISPDNYLLVSIVTIIISLSASLLPALIATKIKPISAIKFS